MISILSWNIRGIKSSIERLCQLNRQHKIQFLAIQEPFCKTTKLDRYRRRLGYNFAYANCNNMIWIFTDEDVECQVYSDTEQQLSCFIKIGDDTISITTVYPKCKASLRESLWEDLSLIASSQNLEWMVLGDFNYITDQTEKIGGNPHRMEKSLPLLECIGDCDLYDLGFIGSSFTWSCNISHIKYFKFLNFWVDKPDFQDIVKQAWQIDVQGSQEHHWRHFRAYKNNGKKVANLEDVCLQDNSTTNMVNLNEANALLIRHYKTEEAFWRQKAGIKWHAEGDLNTKIFHSVITSRRQRLSLKKIKKWGREDNEMLCSIPTMQELKDTVFSMDPGSAPCPDGMTGIFYHKCWDIISTDLLNMIIEIFKGGIINRAISHSCLILIPKVKSPQEFSDLRPISLSNFSCKILSKLINGRLTSIMDKIISQNQSGFMKGRSISENITLTQEMVHNMNKAEPDDNVVMKLDMAKLGFSDSWVDLIHRIISNNWYSININGTRNGFYKSTRGLKQGDPLSPSLFVIGAELLSRMLNHLSNDSFVPFTCKSNGPSITHLCYADDTILFSSGDRNSITMMMDKLSEYEKISGQPVNKRKSGFMVHSKASDSFIQDIINLTGFAHQKLPFNYLISPIFAW
ncbi:uncharacterized protein LOC132043459 [Lycium ferocissimum]|uniref:uncharacterized protein LOC132043459 n=1 Tax=Lycium ferocissimum TaxID=112874 RepID=UPI002814C198|nr:uncharacterized protein LOC132043459 [Lycium ferocissimum]